MPKARRRNLHRRLIYTTLFSIAASTSAVAQDSETLDCSKTFTFEDVTYDLKSLASERTINRTRETPPTTTEDELRFNICQDLTLKDGVPESDQCPEGTRACLTQTNMKDDLDPRVIITVPLAQTSLLKPIFATLHSPDGLSIQIHGPPYPPKTSSEPQSLNITLLCTQDSESEPIFLGHENDITSLSVEWKTSAGCPAKASDGGDNKGGDSGGGEKDAGDDASSSGSGIGWFFLLLLISFMGYFAVGAYYNYNNFGATGWDLVPHRDFWRDVPYLLRDFTDHLCSTLRPGRQGSRRGYVAV